MFFENVLYEELNQIKLSHLLCFIFLFMMVEITKRQADFLRDNGRALSLKSGALEVSTEIVDGRFRMLSFLCKINMTESLSLRVNKARKFTEVTVMTSPCEAKAFGLREQKIPIFNFRRLAE